MKDCLAQEEECNGRIGSTYKLGVCQFGPRFLDRNYNHERINALAAEAKQQGCAVVVFPECCTSGYTTEEDLAQLSEIGELVLDGSSIGSVSFLCELANTMGLFVFCGFPERVDTSVYNSLGLFFPDGRRPHVYRKCHMWEREGSVFTPGEPGFAAKGPAGAMAGMICYDLEFPETARCLSIGGADVIAVATANMEPWGEHQDVYVRARAMENCVYIALANHVGDIGSARSVGSSTIVDPFGKILCKASKDNEEVQVGTIDINRCVDARERTGYWHRRRPGSYCALSELDKRASRAAGSALGRRGTRRDGAPRRGR